MNNVRDMLKNLVNDEFPESDQLHAQMDSMIQEVVGRSLKERVEHQVRCRLLEHEQKQ